jgi:hypothetical protein
MADYVNSQLESALETLLNITEKSGNLRKDLKQDIVDSVSILRNIFVNLKNSEEEQNIKTNQLEDELNKARVKLRNSRVANIPGCALPSRGGIGQPPTPSMQNQLPSIGGAKKLCSEAVNTSGDK